jgi:hypothetical protein
MPQDPTTPRPITVFVHSYNRPFYLWASLDSLYRSTRHPHRFVFIEMDSDDPLVRQVVAGFERRGMFSEAVWSPRGEVDSLRALLWSRLGTIGPFFAYFQTGVIIETTDSCLECYSAHRDAYCSDPHRGPGPAAPTEPR